MMREPEGELARRKDEGEPLSGHARAVYNILVAPIRTGVGLRLGVDYVGDGPPEKEMGAMNDEVMRKFLVEWLNKRGVVFARPDDVRPGAGDDTTLVMGAFNLDELAADLVRWLRPAVW